MSSEKKKLTILGKRILWISYLHLESALDKATWLETSQHLAKRGHRILLVTPSAKARIKLKDVQVISIPLRYVPVITNAIYALFLWFFLSFLALYSKCDFIIVHAGSTTLSAIPLSVLPRSLRPKIVLDCRSVPIVVFGLSGYLRAFVFDVSFLVARRLFDGVTTVTPMMRNEICSRYNLDSKAVGVWTNGTSLTIFDSQKAAKEGIGLRTGFGLEDKFVVFYHGSLTCRVDRGIVQCIDGMKILKNKRDDAILFLLGSGDSSLLSTKIQEKGVQDKVMIHGPVSYADVPAYIAMSDVTIVPLPDIPKWRHQMPLKLLEYLAMGKVVIATDIPANRNIIGSSKCGIFIPSLASEVIAGAIIYARTNKERLDAWGSTGRTLIEREYTFQKVAEELEKELLKL